jgi:hypothetical protein
MGFQKTQIFAPNPYLLSYDFTKNQQFWTKTDQNSVFLGCDSHIADQLYKTVPYMSFYRF